jgi:organic hydroperoxide reductase OsmC/OhrA
VDSDGRTAVVVRSGSAASAASFAALSSSVGEEGLDRQVRGGHLQRRSEGGDHREQAQLAEDIELPSITDQGLATQLVRASHHLCPYSNAIRGNIDVTLTVNGVAVTELEPLPA